ncbi:MAG: hypothetical protein ACK6CU_10100 [Deltaproteobacteria bacterium]
MSSRTATGGSVPTRRLLAGDLEIEVRMNTARERGLFFVVAVTGSLSRSGMLRPMDFSSNRSSSVLLLEGLLVIGLLCGLLATRLPDVARYRQQQREAEAEANLRTMFMGVSAYYQMEHWGAGTRTNGRPTPTTNCTVPNATTTNTPGPTPRALDLAREPESFRAIGFDMSSPVLFQYAIARSPGSRCGNPPGADLYLLQARGDLDGDGTLSLYEMAIHSDQENSLYRDVSVRVERARE